MAKIDGKSGSPTQDTELDGEAGKALDEAGAKSEEATGLDAEARARRDALDEFDTAPPGEGLLDDPGFTVPSLFARESLPLEDEPLMARDPNDPMIQDYWNRYCTPEFRALFETSLPPQYEFNPLFKVMMAHSLAQVAAATLVAWADDLRMTLLFLSEIPADFDPPTEEVQYYLPMIYQLYLNGKVAAAKTLAANWHLKILDRQGEALDKHNRRVGIKMEIFLDDLVGQMQAAPRKINPFSSFDRRRFEKTFDEFNAVEEKRDRLELESPRMGRASRMGKSLRAEREEVFQERNWHLYHKLVDEHGKDSEKVKELLLALGSVPRSFSSELAPHVYQAMRAEAGNHPEGSVKNLYYGGNDYHATPLAVREYKEKAEEIRREMRAEFGDDTDAIMATRLSAQSDVQRSLDEEQGVVAKILFPNLPERLSVDGVTLPQLVQNPPEGWVPVLDKNVGGWDQGETYHRMESNISCWRFAKRDDDGNVLIERWNEQGEMLSRKTIFAEALEPYYEKLDDQQETLKLVVMSDPEIERITHYAQNIFSKLNVIRTLYKEARQAQTDPVMIEKIREKARELEAYISVNREDLNFALGDARTFQEKMAGFTTLGIDHDESDYNIDRLCGTVNALLYLFQANGDMGRDNQNRPRSPLDLLLHEIKSPGFHPKSPGNFIRTHGTTVFFAVAGGFLLMTGVGTALGGMSIRQALQMGLAQLFRGTLQQRLVQAAIFSAGGVPGAEIGNEISRLAFDTHLESTFSAMLKDPRYGLQDLVEAYGSQFLSSTAMCFFATQAGALLGAASETMMASQSRLQQLIGHVIRMTTSPIDKAMDLVPLGSSTSALAFKKFTTEVLEEWEETGFEMESKAAGYLAILKNCTRPKLSSGATMRTIRRTAEETLVAHDYQENRLPQLLEQLRMESELTETEPEIEVRPDGTVRVTLVREVVVGDRTYSRSLVREYSPSRIPMALRVVTGRYNIENDAELSPEEFLENEFNAEFNEDTGEIHVNPEQDAALLLYRLRAMGCTVVDVNTDGDVPRVLLFHALGDSRILLNFDELSFESAEEVNALLDRLDELRQAAVERSEDQDDRDTAGPPIIPASPVDVDDDNSDVSTTSPAEVDLRTLEGEESTGPMSDDTSFPVLILDPLENVTPEMQAWFAGRVNRWFQSQLEEGPGNLSVTAESFEQALRLLVEQEFPPGFTFRVNYFYQTQPGNLGAVIITAGPIDANSRLGGLGFVEFTTTEDGLLVSEHGLTPDYETESYALGVLSDLNIPQLSQQSLADAMAHIDFILDKVFGDDAQDVRDTMTAWSARGRQRFLCEVVLFYQRVVVPRSGGTSTTRVRILTPSASRRQPGRADYRSRFQDLFRAATERESHRSEPLEEIPPITGTSLSSGHAVPAGRDGHWGIDSFRFSEIDGVTYLNQLPNDEFPGGRCPFIALVNGYQMQSGGRLSRLELLNAYRQAMEEVGLPFQRAYSPNTVRDLARAYGQEPRSLRIGGDEEIAQVYEALENGDVVLLFESGGTRTLFLDEEGRIIWLNFFGMQDLQRFTPEGKPVDNRGRPDRRSRLRLQGQSVMILDSETVAEVLNVNSERARDQEQTPREIRFEDYFHPDVGNDASLGIPLTDKQLEELKDFRNQEFFVEVNGHRYQIQSNQGDWDVEDKPTRVTAYRVDDQGCLHSVVLEVSDSFWNFPNLTIAVTDLVDVSSEIGALQGHLENPAYARAQEFYQSHFGTGNFKVVKSRREGREILRQAHNAGFPFEVSLKTRFIGGGVEWIVVTGAQALHRNVGDANLTHGVYFPSTILDGGYHQMISYDQAQRLALESHSNLPAYGGLLAPLANVVVYHGGARSVLSFNSSDLSQLNLRLFVDNELRVAPADLRAYQSGMLSDPSPISVDTVQYALGNNVDMSSEVSPPAFGIPGHPTSTLSDENISEEALNKVRTDSGWQEALETYAALKGLGLSVRLNEREPVVRVRETSFAKRSKNPEERSSLTRRGEVVGRGTVDHHGQSLTWVILKTGSEERPINDLLLLDEAGRLVSESDEVATRIFMDHHIEQLQETGQDEDVERLKEIYEMFSGVTRLQLSGTHAETMQEGLDLCAEIARLMPVEVAFYYLYQDGEFVPYLQMGLVDSVRLAGSDLDNAVMVFHNHPAFTHKIGDSLGPTVRRAMPSESDAITYIRFYLDLEATIAKGDVDHLVDMPFFDHDSQTFRFLIGSRFGAVQVELFREGGEPRIRVKYVPTPGAESAPSEIVETLQGSLEKASGHRLESQSDEQKAFYNIPAENIEVVALNSTQFTEETGYQVIDSPLGRPDVFDLDQVIPADDAIIAGALGFVMPLPPTSELSHWVAAVMNPVQVIGFQETSTRTVQSIDSETDLTRMDGEEFAEYVFEHEGDAVYSEIERRLVDLDSDDERWHRALDTLLVIASFHVAGHATHDLVNRVFENLVIPNQIPVTLNHGAVRDLKKILRSELFEAVVDARRESRARATDEDAEAAGDAVSNSYTVNKKAGELGLDTSDLSVRISQYGKDTSLRTVMAASDGTVWLEDWGRLQTRRKGTRVRVFSSFVRVAVINYDTGRCDEVERNTWVNLNPGDALVEVPAGEVRLVLPTQMTKPPERNDAFYQDGNLAEDVFLEDDDMGMEPYRLRNDGFVEKVPGRLVWFPDGTQMNNASTEGVISDGQLVEASNIQGFANTNDEIPVFDDPSVSTGFDWTGYDASVANESLDFMERFDEMVAIEELADDDRAEILDRNERLREDFESWLIAVQPGQDIREELQEAIEAQATALQNFMVLESDELPNGVQAINRYTLRTLLDLLTLLSGGE